MGLRVSSGVRAQDSEALVIFTVWILRRGRSPGSRYVCTSGDERPQCEPNETIEPVLCYRLDGASGQREDVDGGAWLTAVTALSIQNWELAAYIGRTDRKPSSG